jgi:hypothetical protein
MALISKQELEGAGGQFVEAINRLLATVSPELLRSQIKITHGAEFFARYVGWWRFCLMRRILITVKIINLPREELYDIQKIIRHEICDALAGNDHAVRVVYKN